MPSITLRLNKTLQIVSKTCQLVAGKSTTQQQNIKSMLYHKTINRCLIMYKSLIFHNTNIHTQAAFQSSAELLQLMQIVCE